MKEFILSALPWVIIGLCIVVICANKKSKKNDYISEGMCIGMSLGILFSTMLNINLCLGLSIGMLIGEAIGISIKK